MEEPPTRRRIKLGPAFDSKETSAPGSGVNTSVYIGPHTTPPDDEDAEAENLPPHGSGA